MLPLTGTTGNDSTVRPTQYCVRGKKGRLGEKQINHSLNIPYEHNFSNGTRIDRGKTTIKLFSISYIVLEVILRLFILSRS